LIHFYKRDGCVVDRMPLELPGVGIFGTSPAALLLVPALKARGFPVEALWGRTSGEAEKAAQKLGINFHTSQVDDVLLKKDVALIIILCPPSLHSQIAVKALGIGKHVVCGVPGGLGQAECLRMVQAAQYYPSLMAVLAYGQRFLPSMMTLRSQILDGFLGENIHLVDARIECGSILEETYSWCCDSGMGGGVLSVLGSHVIDLLTYLDLGRVVRVSATLKTLTSTTDNIGGIRQITADDVAVVQLQLVGGTFVMVTINSQLVGFRQSLRVCGTAGSISIDQDQVVGLRRGSQQEVVLHSSSSSDEEVEGDPALPGIHRKGLLKMVEQLGGAFSGARGSFQGQKVQGGQQWGEDPNVIAATFEDGLYAQAVLEALRQSSESRQWEKVISKGTGEGVGDGQAHSPWQA